MSDQKIHSLFVAALGKIEGANPELLDIQPASNSNFGDLQTNVALQHSRLLKKNPMDIATEIIRLLPENKLLSTVQVAKPGFINISLTTESLNEWLNKFSADIKPPQVKASGPVIIDYSSPNIAKTMHVAHIRSTIIGDSLKRIYRSLGYEVIADNHLGDWGTQFGKLLYAWKNFPHPQNFSGVELLENLYQEFNRQAEAQPELEDRAREELVLLQKKQNPNYQLWQEFIQISLQEFHEIYKRLDVAFDAEHGESFYNDALAGTVEELHKKNICRESEGAMVIFFENDELPPFLIQKKDGSFLYSTTDIATVSYRLNHYKPCKIIYVTDSRQLLHFKQVFRVAEMLNLNNSDFYHVPFGMMRFSEGAVMSTRKGGVIRLRDLLDEAEKRARQIIQNADLKEDEKDNIARVVGIGAVKYQDLSQNPASDIVFEWDKALSMEGNSSPYLQYAFARVQGIKRKYEERYTEDYLNSGYKISLPSEKAIALHLMQFHRTIQVAADSFRPNLIADYLYQLAQKFSSFYAEAPILPEADPEIRHSRIRLALLCAETVKYGLDLLGIDTLPRM